MKLETESGRSRTYIHELKVRRLPTKLRPHMYPRVRVDLSPLKSYNIFATTYLLKKGGMNMGKNYHITYDKDATQWKVIAEKALKSSFTFDTKEEAIKKGKELCKKEKSELYIHNKDGKISNSNSYGNDPCPPKDTK